MRTVFAGAIGLWLSLGTWHAPANADGGSLRFSGVKGGYRISVFTAPTPLRAGTVDFSALVQDVSTGEPAVQVQVIFRLSRSGRLPLEYPATTEAATNKLFRAVQFELPEPGRWDMQVSVVGSQGSVVLGCEVEAAERLPRWPEMWPWIAWPVPVVAIFLINALSCSRERSLKARRRTWGSATSSSGK
jgi:hypothetical protein